MKDKGRKLKRIPELDYMKGMGIVVIAIFHLVFRPMLGPADYVIKALGWAFIGIYFMLSGYTCRTDLGIRASYKHRIVHLLVPVALTELILLIFGGIYCILVHDYTIGDVVYDGIVTFLRPELSVRIAGEGASWGEGGILFNNLSPVWFIWSMIWAELFFHPLRILIAKRGVMTWILVVVFLFGIQVPMYLFLDPQPWGLSILPTYVLFMLIGAKFRERDGFEQLARVPAHHAVWISVLCFAAHMALFNLNGDESYYASVYGKHGVWDVFTVILQALIALPAVYFLCRGLGRVRILSKILDWLGKHTLPVLLMHALFGMMYADLLHNYIKPGATYWYLEPRGIEVTFEIVGKSILTMILSLLTCVPMAMLWDKVLGFFFGKKKKEVRDGETTTKE